jgi:hypothetical protein
MIFIVEPKLGLCNQLQTIVKGILLSIKYQRDLFIHNFQINLNTKTFANINEILDIDEINKFLKHYNYNIKILKELDCSILNKIEDFKLPNIDYNKISDLRTINTDIENYLQNEYIYLGNIVSICLQNSLNLKYYDFKNKYYQILSNLKFNKEFYQLKDKIKNDLKLTNFTVIHLRIEDDALKHFSHFHKIPINEYNNKLKSFYELHINNNKNTNIYISSGILNFDNKINCQYYLDLKGKYNNIFDKSNIQIDKYYLNNRELIAIVDLLICFDSSKFIGCGISSFSRVIEGYLNYNSLIKKSNIILA